MSLPKPPTGKVHATCLDHINEPAQLAEAILHRRSSITTDVNAYLNLAQPCVSCVFLDCKSPCNIWCSAGETRKMGGGGGGGGGGMFVDLRKDSIISNGSIIKVIIDESPEPMVSEFGLLADLSCNGHMATSLRTVLLYQMQRGLSPLSSWGVFVDLLGYACVADRSVLRVVIEKQEKVSFAMLYAQTCVPPPPPPPPQKKKELRFALTTNMHEPRLCMIVHEHITVSFILEYHWSVSILTCS